MIEKLKKKYTRYFFKKRYSINLIQFSPNTSFPLFQVCTSMISRDLWYRKTNFACMREYTFVSKTLSRASYMPLRYISSARPQASSNFSTDISRVPRSLKSTPSCSSFYRSFHTLIGVLSRFASRSDRRQLKRSYRPLQRKAALYSRLPVKGSISRLFRNKSRANREIHRWANISSSIISRQNVPSPRTFLEPSHYAEFFYRRFSTYDESWKFFFFFFRIFLF